MRVSMMMCKEVIGANLEGAKVGVAVDAEELGHPLVVGEGHKA